MTLNAGKETMLISWGPQHPISGQFRIILDTDGEKVLRLVPDLGFTHRGIEKILEKRTFTQGIVPVERLSMLDAANFGLAYVRAVEEIIGVEVPKRAQYIRTILCEISRINSHLYAFGLTAEAGGGYPAVFLWTVADRELFLDLAEMLVGARWSYSFFIPGGVRRDIPEGFKEKALKTLNYFNERLKIYRESWLENEIFKVRTQGVGLLSREEAVRLGATGPCLRGSGFPLDVRKDEPYEAYEEMDFNLITRPEGDAYARTVVRYLEMIESTKIIRQAIENIPKGPFRKRVPMRAPKGEAYTRVETARGEVGLHMITNESMMPYRVKINSPSLRNLYVLSKLPEVTDILVADVPVVLWSFDPWYLDADR
ncbi:MAG: NADH-quinone oxidoreductase subunit D [Candidatus Bathyarchaeia archaeon]